MSLDNLKLSPLWTHRLEIQINRSAAYRDCGHRRPACLYTLDIVALSSTRRVLRAIVSPHIMPCLLHLARIWSRDRYPGGCHLLNLSQPTCTKPARKRSILVSLKTERSRAL